MATPELYYAENEALRELYLGLLDQREMRTGLLGKNGPKELAHWQPAHGVRVLRLGSIPRASLEEYIREFSATYTKRGWRVIGAPPRPGRVR